MSVWRKCGWRSDEEASRAFLKHPQAYLPRGLGRDLVDKIFPYPCGSCAYDVIDNGDRFAITLDDLVLQQDAESRQIMGLHGYGCISGFGDGVYGQFSAGLNVQCWVQELEGRGWLTIPRMATDQERLVRADRLQPDLATEFGKCTYDDYVLVSLPGRNEQELTNSTVMPRLHAQRHEVVASHQVLGQIDLQALTGLLQSQCDCQLVTNNGG